MAEFLEVLETIRAEDATRERLYSREGASARGQRSVRFIEARNELAKLIEDVHSGKRSAYRLQEAMSTSDFPLLFGDILDKSMLRRYTAWPSTWPAIAKRRTVRDFRDIRITPPMRGLESRLDGVPELTEYPKGALSEQTPLTYRVQKYGRKAALSWEMLVNDDQNMLTDIPDRFATAARRTEDRAVADMWLDANGPSAAVFTAGNHNIINTTNGADDDNPPFDLDGLQDAFTVLSRMTDEDGEYIMTDFVTLVVPPALEIRAQNILNATELRLTSEGGTSTQQMIVNNWMKNRVKLVVDPYIPQIVTTGSRGQTTWALFASPDNGRPLMELAFLTGHEQPEIFVKEPNARRVGGAGGADPFNGDFDLDAVEYKVRHVLGGAVIDPIAAVASNGTSS